VWLVLGGAVLAGALLRFPFLGHQSFWLDETYTVTIAGQHSLTGVWRSVKETESTPPLYYLLTWTWTSLVGSASEAAVRAPSAAAGLLSVPASFVAVRRLVGQRVALGVAWLCATSPLLIWYSLDARAYSLLVLFSMLSVWALVNLLERPTARHWALWALAGAACLWTHYYAVFLLAGELAVIIWRRPELRRALAGSAAVTVLLALPVLPVFLEQRSNTARTAWIGQRPLIDRIEQAVREHAMGPNVPWAALEAAGLVVATAAFLAGLVLTARAGKGALSLVVLAASGIGVPLLLSVTGVADYFFARNLLMVWIALAAVAALALVRLRTVPLIVYVVLSSATALAIESDWRYQNADWRGAVASLRTSAGRSPVVVYPGLQAPVASLYLRREQGIARARLDEAWLVVEPARLEDRDLRPIPGAPPPGVPGPPFKRLAAREYHGFRLVRVRAPRPARVDPAGPSGHPVRGFAPAVLGP
jgi:mannosyltransferase